MFSKFAQPQPFSLLDQVGRDYNSDSSDNEKKFPRKALPLNKVSFSSIFENEDNEDLIQLKKRLKSMTKEQFAVFIGELMWHFRTLVLISLQKLLQTHPIARNSTHMN